jgi:hypothetical protein
LGKPHFSTGFPIKGIFNSRLEGYGPGIIEITIPGNYPQGRWGIESGVSKGFMGLEMVAGVEYRV